MKNRHVGAGLAPALPSLSVACSHYNGSIAMADDIFSDTERRMQKAIEALRHDLAVVRTGRASAALLERIQIDYYGVPTPINQVATIHLPDARILMLPPLDLKLLIYIQKAIQRSEPGI